MSVAPPPSLAAVALVVAGLLAARSPEAQPAGGGYLDSTYAEWVDSAGPFVSIQDLQAWIDTEQAYPMVVSSPYGRRRTDSDQSRQYLYAIGWDSTAWMQTPSGVGVRVDPYAIWQMGGMAGTYLGYDSLQAADDYSLSWDSEFVSVGFSRKAALQSVFLWAGGVLSLVVLVIGFSIFRLRSSLARAEERGRQLAESRRRFADNREAERIRLARELHDGPLQDLQAVRMRLGMARLASGDLTQPCERTPLIEAQANVQDDLLRVIGELRGISEGLRPPALAAFGLAAAVRSLLDRQTSAHPHVSITHAFSDKGDDLPEAVRIALYRMVQESTNNALKHGDPTRLHVEYGRDETGDLRLTVTDDGSGFAVPQNLHELEQNGHLGLVGMAERAESIGGTLTIASQPGSTRLVVHVPEDAFSFTPAPQPA